MISITLHKKIYHIIFAIAVAQRSLKDHSTYFFCVQVPMPLSPHTLSPNPHKIIR
uniref:Uncharacterized protein n=1 Tax=Lepeophtheirus salmonis TaxID=72036 RepID=A0A0K2TKP3_LEPSM